MQKNMTILTSLSGLIVASVTVVALARMQSASSVQPRPTQPQAGVQPQAAQPSLAHGSPAPGVFPATQTGNTLLDNALEQSPSSLISQGMENTLPRPVTKNPIPPEASKALLAQANRALAVEKEARTLLGQGRTREAEQTCYRALALSPKLNGQPMASSTFQLLGDIFQEQGRYAEANDSYFKARQHTRNLELDLSIALSYLKIGDLKNAHKFYVEDKVFGQDLPAEKKAAYFAQLPGTKTAKTMEASLYFARGCEKSSFAQVNEAVEDYKKALALVPRNGRIAFVYAGDLARFSRGEEATPYWARAAVFGKGETAHEALIRLHDVLMPDKVEQALAEARKIKE